MGTTNAVGGEALKPVSTSMEICFDVEWIGPTSNRVKWSIFPKDGKSIPQGELNFTYGYAILLDGNLTTSSASITVPISAGNSACGFVPLSTNELYVVSIGASTFKKGSTVYASRDAFLIEDNATNKVDKNQGAVNAGKVLGIGSNGMVTPVDAGGSGGSGGSGNFVTYIFSNTQSAYNTPLKFFTKIIEIVVPGDLICFRICKSGTSNICCSFNGMVGSKTGSTSATSVYLIGSGGFIKDAGYYLFGGDTGITNHGANIIIRTNSIDLKGYKDFSGSLHQVNVLYSDSAKWGTYDVIIWHNTGGYGAGSLDNMPDT